MPGRVYLSNRTSDFLTSFTKPLSRIYLMLHNMDMKSSENLSSLALAHCYIRWWMQAIDASIKSYSNAEWSIIFHLYHFQLNFRYVVSGENPIEFGLVKCEHLVTICAQRSHAQKLVAMGTHTPGPASQLANQQLLNGMQPLGHDCCTN